MTLANSIIGVSVLAMPFCFKQCGVVLATLVLLVSCILSRLACHFLVKSAVMSRRRNFELLAFHVFGHMGKFLVELFIIGFLVGTCIAFFVVMGDLGPQIVGKVINKNPEDIRTSLLVTTSVFIVLPLGLLRNIDSLSSLCTATIIFYLCLVLKIVTESMQHIFAGDWYEYVYYWRPSGILQCIPIFSMALFCQTQLFEIYETIPNVSLEKMNEVVRGALNICTMVYLCVGFFGYVAFCTQPFTGNILMSFEPSLSSEMIKMGFVFSIAFSFPLVIFPCRASLNSLLFRRIYTHEPSMNYLPEARFRCLTFAIVAVSLITGILIPNIEFVLGLVGSTIGVMICLIFPAIFFISISSKHTNERLLAQVILFTGICIMILSTYANLYALEESTTSKALAITSKPVNQINNLPINLNKADIGAIVNIPNNPEILPDIKDRLPELNIPERSLNLKENDVRQEPPIPVERIVVTKKPAVETQKPVESVAITFAPVMRNVAEKNTIDEEFHKPSKTTMKSDSAKPVESATTKVEGKINAVELKENFVDMQKIDNINSDAIKKEEIELAADAEAANMIAAERHEKLRKTLEKHKLEQLRMMQEQKEILKDIKEQKQEIAREKQRIIEDTQKLKETEKKLKTFNEELLPEAKNNLTNVNSNDKKESSNKLKENNKTDSDKKSDGTRSNAQFKEESKVDNLTAKLPDSKNDNNKEVQTDTRNENSLPAKDADNEALSNREINEERIEEAKVGLSNSKELPKGPILNALTKRVQRESVNELVESIKNNEITFKQNNSSNDANSNLQEKTSLKSEDQKAQYEYLPIALKMQNQSKAENVSVLSEDKVEKNIQVIRRDILENHEREKREIANENDTDKKVTSNISNKDTDYMLNTALVEDEGEKCSKLDGNLDQNLEGKSNERFSKMPHENDFVEAPLIESNVYLSGQEFANAISLDSNIAIGGEYVKLKQRDLKSVDVDIVDEDCNI